MGWTGDAAAASFTMDLRYRQPVLYGMAGTHDCVIHGDLQVHFASDGLLQLQAFLPVHAIGLMEGHTKHLAVDQQLSSPA